MGLRGRRQRHFPAHFRWKCTEKCHFCASFGPRKSLYCCSRGFEHFRARRTWSLFHQFPLEIGVKVTIVLPPFGAFVCFPSFGSSAWAHSPDFSVLWVQVCTPRESTRGIHHPVHPGYMPHIPIQDVRHVPRVYRVVYTPSTLSLAKAPGPGPWPGPLRRMIYL